ncbi:hypothetical protein EV363DRAFT_1247609 [Boletus edulis]|nr:hypothetical protein EV363DRAFT_1247609 [Boletus edulis]
MGGGLGRVSRHPEYYLSDGSVSFLTGSTLFRVHRSFFERESDVFRDLFASAAEEDPQSGSDARPFTLDVHPDDFARFCWVWYDREYSYGQQPKENWVTILRLSTRWAFPRIKELAVRELEALHLPPAERIAIYNEHGIDDERLFSSYVEMCRSPTLPSEEEARLIQMDALVNILQAREDAQRKAVELGHESPTSACLEDETLREIVSRFFKPAGLNLRSNGTSSTGSEVQAQASNLNGERAQGTSSANETITLGEPQVPNKKAQATSGQSHAVGEAEDKTNTTKATQAKETEEKEKAEKERKQEQEREARERSQKTGGQRQQQNTPRRGGK